MIILFRGTEKNRNMSPEVLSIYAAMNAIKYNRKTLVLQFTTTTPVEKILIGKADDEIALKTGQQQMTYSDKGIDTLIRKVETKSFDDTTFTLACRSMLNSENLLDVAGVSKKTDFEKEVYKKGKTISSLIKIAKNIYDDIYILGNGKNEEQMKMLNRFADLSIICIPQGNKEEIPVIESVRNPSKSDATNKHLLMVTEFDRRSSYDVARIKKLYNEKQIAILPYSTAFKDAYNSSDVLSFAVRNSKIEDADSNFEFFNMIFDVQKQMMENEVPEEPRFEYTRLHQEKTAKEATPLKNLTSKNVRYTKKYKGFLFWKKEINGYEVTLDDFEDEETPEDDNEYSEDEEYETEMTGDDSYNEEESEEDYEEEYDEQDDGEEDDYDDDVVEAGADVDLTFEEPVETKAKPAKKGFLKAKQPVKKAAVGIAVNEKAKSKNKVKLVKPEEKPAKKPAKVQTKKAKMPAQKPAKKGKIIEAGADLELDFTSSK